MLKLQTLPVERQRNVGRALAIALDRDRPAPLTPRTIETGRAVVAKTEQLQDPPDVSAIQVDVSTDQVVTASHRILRAWEKALAGDLVALQAPQQEALDAARFLTNRWFPHGIRFVRQQMSIEWDALQPMVTSFDDPEVVAAAAKLSLGPLVEHMKKHCTQYGQSVGLGEGKPKEAPVKAEAKDSWQGAMTQFAITVLADYANDSSVRVELLGVFEQQLAEHRAELAAARKKRKATSNM